MLRLAKHFGRPIMRRKLPKVDVPKETRLSHRFSLPCTRIAQAILAAKVTKGERSQGNKAFAPLFFTMYKNCPSNSCGESYQRWTFPRKQSFRRLPPWCFCRIYRRRFLEHHEAHLVCSLDAVGSGSSDYITENKVISFLYLY